MYRKLVILTAAFGLSGCIAQTDIQAKYMAQEEDCRDHATSRTGVDGAGSSVAAQFSECMNKSGWHISGPKPPTQVVQNPPTGAPSTNPTAYPAAATVKPAAALEPAKTPVLSPPTGAPSPNPNAARSTAAGAANVTPLATAPSTTPSAAVATPDPVPATYQPARPSSVTAVPYGQGAGRQF